MLLSSFAQSWIWITDFINLSLIIKIKGKSKRDNFADDNLIDEDNNAFNADLFCKQ